MPGAGDLFATAEELLVAAAEALDTVPDQLDTSYAGAPDRQFVAPGLPVHDCCEQLAVWVNPLGEGARTPQVLAADVRINQVTFRVHATRCIPQGEIVGKQYVPPDPAALSAAAAQLLADGWALWNHLFNMVNADLLFTKCGDLVRWGGSALTPSGGCAGWEIFFTVGLDGYAEDLTT